MPKQTFFNLPDHKRDHILEVALGEFAEKGYRLASISSIVAAAGIAKGSFYQYFQDKDDLYIHLVTTMIAEPKLAVVEQERPGTTGLTDFLRAVSRRMIEEFAQRPQAMKLALDLVGLLGEPIYQKIMEPYKDVAELFFVPFIRREMESGRMDPAVNVELLNFMLMSMGQYLIASVYSAPEFSGITPQLIDRVTDDLEYILVNGIYKKTPSDTPRPPE